MGEIETFSWEEMEASIARSRRNPFLRVWWWLRRVPTPRDGWRELVWFAQRGRRGWSDRDNWSMFSYLSIVMADMLADLRKYGIGYHCVHGGFPGTDDHKCNSEDWNQMLQRIEFALRYYMYVIDGDASEHYGFDQWMGMHEPAQAAIRQAFADLGEYWGGLWD